MKRNLNKSLIRNTDKVKQVLGYTLYVLLILVITWVSITNLIQAFKCPKMTQTELFLHIPKSAVCDWKTDK